VLPLKNRVIRDSVVQLGLRETGGETRSIVRCLFIPPKLTHRGFHNGIAVLDRDFILPDTDWI
jgi:hypothetical protein